jgi:BASS family bile acid:Na+ symporter
MLGMGMTRSGRSFAEVLRRPADVGIVVALSANDLASVGRVLAAAVALHDLPGLAAGYWAGCLLGRDERTSRTLAIEVGMQRSGLG